MRVKISYFRIIELGGDCKIGQAKNSLIESMESERNCYECGSTVNVNWETSSYYCDSCKEAYTGMKQCSNCLNMIDEDTEISICGDCVDYELRD